MGVTIVMPCFNEAGRIDKLLGEMPTEIRGHRVSLVVVDDGSTDDSVDQIQRFASGQHGPDALNVELLIQPKNRGKGAALRRAREEIDRGSFDALVWMDADGQHPASSLAELVGPVLDEGIDLCVGSRYLGRLPSSGRAPLNRRLVRSTCIRCVERITRFTVTDPFSGFRCFSPTAVSLLDLEGSGYEAELESCFLIAQAGLSYREIAIPRIYGPGSSKMGARYGALLGRIIVVSGYARTIYGARNRASSTARIPAHG